MPRHNPKSLIAAVLLGASATLSAQTRPATATAPTTLPKGAVNLSATITSVKGVVQVRNGEDQEWQPAAVGTKLGQESEIRTGLRSAVQFVIEPDQVITLDRLGTLKVLQAYLEPGKVTTDLGVKYGRTRYDIQATDLQHQSTIRSPGSTLAIRGTDVTYEDQVPWIPTAVSRTGRAQIRNLRRETVAFGGNRPASVAADKSSPAQQAQTNTRVDPRGAFAARTSSEQDLLLDLTPIGGIDAQGLAAVRALQEITGFTGSFVGTPPVPGPLFFQLDWFGTSGQGLPANLDLLVTDPKGQTASALNPTIGTGSAIGNHGGDDRGSTGAGAESVSWGLFFPAGAYKVTATHKGGDSSQVFIQVFQGQSADPIKTFGIEPQPSIVLKAGESFSGSVTPNPTSTVTPTGTRQASRSRKR